MPQATSVPQLAWDQAVQRFAHSRTLQHRAALRQLFLYLAEKTLAGEGDLKEYVIGVDAFSKSQNYDPQTDASVRVQVSRLRHCLSEYYQNERPDDPVRIEIPKGQFGLTFEDRGEAQVAEREDPPAATMLERRLRRMTWALWALAAIALTTTVAGVLTGKRQPASPALSPDLMAIWGEYVSGDRPVLIVLGAPLFAKFTTSETGVFFRDPRLNEWEQASAFPDIAKIGRAVGGVQITPSRIYTGVGEATGAFELSRLLSRSRQEVSLRRSHSLAWDDFKNRNVVVLGAPKHNVHLNNLPVNIEFTFYRGGIRNLRPLAGEPEMFDPKFAPGFEEIEEDHALISRFPGLHGVGETTVLAGGSTEGTLAAVEFATKPQYAAELIARLRDPAGKMPRAYQVVLRARFKSQTPVEIHYVTHRLLGAAKIVADLDRVPTPGSRRQE